MANESLRHKVTNVDKYNRMLKEEKCKSREYAFLVGIEQIVALYSIISSCRSGRDLFGCILGMAFGAAAMLHLETMIDSLLKTRDLRNKIEELENKTGRYR